MKSLFYPKLALDGMRKNKRLYLPYIITSLCMVMMQYIVLFLKYSYALTKLPGVDSIRMIIDFGGWVVAIFIGIFMLYTNSTLIRHRKKEFGIYNILGMGKGNIGLILFWENLIILLSSLVSGLGIGIAFSKLAELGLTNMIKRQAIYDFVVPKEALLRTIIIFCVIFFLLFINDLRQVRLSSAVNLLHGANVGEKPPKANWFVGILGFVLLGAAYYLALSIKNPLSAIVWFFIAVVMVIVATYLVMIAGSVIFCRVLQKRKGYYYKSNHFISVSSMAYRMKRNGAGLASICILATMVLVMISSTATLYIGNEDSLNRRYPRDINMDFAFSQSEHISNENLDKIRDTVSATAKKYGVNPTDIDDYRYCATSGVVRGDTVLTDPADVSDFNITNYSELSNYYILSLDEYNAIMGENESLNPGEALIYTYRTDYTGDTITFKDGPTLKLKKKVDKVFGNVNIAVDVVSTVALVVPNFESVVDDMSTITNHSGSSMTSMRWTYSFDTGASADTEIELTDALKSEFKNKENYNCTFCTIESHEANKDDFLGVFGGLFYLGIILSVVFIFATVLIIYYKQISEGYEDRSRFDIMQKVGLTKKEIQKSINSQLLTVFLLPLAGAGIHLAFAFPIIRKLLMLFNFYNLKLFILTTIICFVIFAVLYMIVYRITSNAYYRIVSDTKDYRSQY